MYWAFPIQVCALALYYFIIKKRVGRFLNPYAKHDMLVPVIVMVVWSMVGLYFSIICLRFSISSILFLPKARLLVLVRITLNP